MISVIIPYYQLNAGVLSKALVSISRQQPLPQLLSVIVVDDSSPCPVGPEILNAGYLPFKVEVVTQRNSGPGSARNTGLNHVLSSTRYIAFLDSDDEWLPDHLAKAMIALDCGYDFYFSDFFQLNQNISAFKRAGKFDTNNHKKLNNLSDELYEFNGDMMNQIITGNIIGTPTVVYLYERYKNERFNVELTTAGEDYLFWMALVKKGARIAFSNAPTVKCGSGVNIYSSSNWGNISYLLRSHNELKYRKKTLILHELNQDQKNFIKKCIEDLRKSFISSLLHNISHRNKLPMKLILTHIKYDPTTLLYIPMVVLDLISKKIK